VWFLPPPPSLKNTCRKKCVFLFLNFDIWHVRIEDETRQPLSNIISAQKCCFMDEFVVILRTFLIIHNIHKLALFKFCLVFFTFCTCCILRCLVCIVVSCLVCIVVDVLFVLLLFLLCIVVVVVLCVFL